MSARTRTPWRACSNSGPIPGVPPSVALGWHPRICLSIGSQVDVASAGGGGHTLSTTALRRRELNLVRPGFLNLSTTDIWGWVTVVVGCLVHYRMLSSILGLYSMPVDTCPLPSVNCHNQKCPHTFSSVLGWGGGSRQNHPRLRTTELDWQPSSLFNEVMKPPPLVHKMQIFLQMWSFLFNSSMHLSYYVSSTGGLLRSMIRSLLLRHLQLIEEPVWSVDPGNCGDMEQGVTADFLKDYDKDGQELARQKGWGRKIPGRGHGALKRHGGNKAWESGNYQLFLVAIGNHLFSPV